MNTTFWFSNSCLHARIIQNTKRGVHSEFSRNAIYLLALTGTSSATIRPFNNSGQWNNESNYICSFTSTEGNTVSNGDFNNTKMWWRANKNIKDDQYEPGKLENQSNLHPWNLINSYSAVETGTPDNPDQYRRWWNGDLENIETGEAVVTTWRWKSSNSYWQSTLIRVRHKRPINY